MAKRTIQPWEPVAHWEHGRVTEKFVQGGGGLVLSARVVEHQNYGVAWFVYDFQGKLVDRGRERTIVDAQRYIDSGKEEATDATSRSA